MTRTEFIQKRMKPLVTMVEKFVHEEDKHRVSVAIEIFLLRLIMDFEHLSATDASELKESDFGEYGDTVL